MVCVEMSVVIVLMFRVSEVRFVRVICSLIDISWLVRWVWNVIGLIDFEWVSERNVEDILWIVVVWLLFVY